MISKYENSKKTIVNFMYLYIFLLLLSSIYKIFFLLDDIIYVS